jgi:hypothetical protein
VGVDGLRVGGKGKFRGGGLFVAAYVAYDIHSRIGGRGVLRSRSIMAIR